MSNEALKLELLDWLRRVEDETVLHKLQVLKEDLETKPGQFPSPIFGRLKGQITMTDDFNAPLDDMKEYME